jgi:hypothetical protein
MRTVRNTTQLPVRVPLPGGKTLHLGPAKTGQISDQAAEGRSVRRLIEQGTIELLGGDDRTSGDSPDKSGSPAHDSKQGHSRPSGVSSRGNR